MTELEAANFGRKWVAAWNSHDLERILAHYRENVELTSPLVERILGDGRVVVRRRRLSLRVVVLPIQRSSAVKTLPSPRW
jgi:hypothetical protein